MARAIAQQKKSSTSSHRHSRGSAGVAKGSESKQSSRSHREHSSKKNKSPYVVPKATGTQILKRAGVTKAEEKQGRRVVNP